MNPVSLAWLISALTTAGVITRPFGWPEAIWAVSGALLLVVLNLLPAARHWTPSRKAATCTSSSRA